SIISFGFFAILCSCYIFGIRPIITIDVMKNIRNGKILFFLFMSIFYAIGVFIPLGLRMKELQQSDVSSICRSLIRGQLNPVESMFTFYLDIDTNAAVLIITPRTFFNLPINSFTTSSLDNVDDC